MAALFESRAQTDEARATLTHLVSATNDKAVAISEIYARSLSGIRAVFGPDSTRRGTTKGAGRAAASAR